MFQLARQLMLGWGVDQPEAPAEQIVEPLCVVGNGADAEHAPFFAFKHVRVAAAEARLEGEVIDGNARGLADHDQPVLHPGNDPHRAPNPAIARPGSPVS